jgi:uncharacterized protein YjbJ (UPF0337 family)
MNDDSVKGNKWKQLTGKIKDKWGKKRTDNDLGKAGSNKESAARQAAGAAPRSDQGRGRG